MSDILKKNIFLILVICFPLLAASTAFPADTSVSAPPISAHYKKQNSDGTEISCIVTGNETQEERERLHKAGCTLETLRNNPDIDVEVTLKTNTGPRSILMTSKYYLMWLNSGLHAVNISRTLPFAVLNLVVFHPGEALKYLVFSALYNVGLSRNANQTLYPFLGKHLSSYFYPDGRDNRNNDEPESLGLGGHILVISADLIMWWLEAPDFGFNINSLMLGLDLLHFVLDMAI
ncbi:hypothetical protein [Endozoicomonas sp. GU-1]|uniref:hypothetical protein n=1 Tax=Endozoicomonas sp. GU-1 TaxID=3009078 RepID=UPI0022B3F3FF|nr:hypothetical protein [Endozoicomonas sp. GU-1]WBA88197.1 hypothetical protein O3276_09460 [Endozoicomonas sp. GU-1]